MKDIVNNQGREFSKHMLKEPKNYNIIEGVSFNIVKELEKTLNQIYNFRKLDEGLVSMTNDMIHSIHSVILDWHDKNVKDAERIEELDRGMCSKFPTKKNETKNKRNTKKS